MGAGDDDAATAAQQLKLMAAHYVRRHPAPREPGTIRSTGGPTFPPLPIDPGIVDHMRASVTEVAAYVESNVPDASPAPADDRVYAWMRANTRQLDPRRQLTGEAIVFRQRLEHALAMGETEVVHRFLKRQSCPDCGCWASLVWQNPVTRAVCINRRCVNQDGRAHSYELGFLAHRHIRARAKTAAARHAT
ncbi:hypothetical protein [Streptomyces sp. NPDC046862]|uniref:hypothetical protein n=1 Tax=Streptomyces sp. NPDC046862 TaxID=3154603 RepID=UPI003453E962